VLFFIGEEIMYEFKKVDNDTTKLKMKINEEEKEFTIKRDVKLLKEMQSINFKARKRMLIDLAKEGLTKDNLITKKEENGKTYYNNSSWQELENQYIEEETLNVFDNIIKDITGYSMTELMLSLEEAEQDKFSNELLVAILGVDITKQIAP
jgi:hypothetical protein